jgi:predicted DNA-binding protein
MVKQINIPLEDKTHEAFKCACEKKGFTMRAYLLDAIEKLINDALKKAPK